MVLHCFLVLDPDESSAILPSKMAEESGNESSYLRYQTTRVVIMQTERYQRYPSCKISL